MVLLFIENITKKSQNEKSLASPKPSKNRHFFGSLGVLKWIFKVLPEHKAAADQCLVQVILNCFFLRIGHWIFSKSRVMSAELSVAHYDRNARFSCWKEFCFTCPARAIKGHSVTLISNENKIQKLYFRANNFVNLSSVLNSQFDLRINSTRAD